MKKYLKAYIEKIDKDTGKFEAVASTASPDRDGEVLTSKGWELENFKKNPVILWAHRYMEPAIGKAEEIKIEEGQMIVRGEFAPIQGNAFAQQIRVLYEEGFQKALSVGYIPIERDENRITRKELLEISFVPVPANPEALSLLKSKGLNTDPIKIGDEEFSIIEIVEKKEKVGDEGDEIDQRVENPDKFIKESFRTIVISKEKGIKAMIGKYKSDPDGPTHVQSYLFDKEKWTVAEAKKWVEEHKKGVFYEIEEKSAVKNSEGGNPAERVAAERSIPVEVDDSVYEFLKDGKKALQVIDKIVEKLLVKYKEVLRKK